LFTFKITAEVVVNQCGKQCKQAQMEAYKQKQVKTHQKITKVVDGDGLFVVDIFGKNETEVRLLGIDAPEIRRCRKLKQDERETHLPGQLLMELGKVSKQFLSSLAPVNTSVTLVLEKQEGVDCYSRTLAYVLLPDGSCLNEVMISSGYAKPYDKYYCERLPVYQQLNAQARANLRGLYRTVVTF
jgi:micrococcal nuclease